jgi:hypothetical protein
VRYEAYSSEFRRFWIFGVCSSSAKTYVLGALVACEIKSEAARGEVADLVRARKGSRALRAFVCSMLRYCDEWTEGWNI